ncbi:putative senescence regulator S40 [Helianthus debilis subsp. tardiflorus]
MADCHERSLLKDEDFQEDEIWAVGKGNEESNPKVNKSEKLIRYIPPPSSTSYGAPRTILKGSRVTHHQQQKKKQQSSAPMKITDWSKIYNEKPKDFVDGRDAIIHNDDEMMPPHEYINKRVERSVIAPFSMCEGVGRTLKGRDLIKLRNAILTKTGFLE